MSKLKYKNILNSYFMSPWQPKVNVDKLLEQPEHLVKKFIENEIISDINNRKALSNEEKEYIKNVKNNLKVIQESKIYSKKRKRLTLAEQLLIDGSSKLSDEQVRNQQKEKLKKELIKVESKKMDLI